MYRKCCARIKKSDNRKAACKYWVKKLIDKHDESCSSSEKGHCGKGPVHELIYIAGKLMLKFKLKNLSLVRELIKEIYRCECGFERIYFGKFHFIAI